MEPTVSFSDSMCNLKHYMPTGVHFSQDGNFIICDACYKQFNMCQDLHLIRAHLESCSHPMKLIMDYVMISMYVVGMEPEELLLRRTLSSKPRMLPLNLSPHGGTSHVQCDYCNTVFELNTPLAIQHHRDTCSIPLNLQQQARKIDKQIFEEKQWISILRSTWDIIS